MKRKRHRNFISLKGLIFILWLCCISFFPQAHKIAEADDIGSFQCTLTIQRTDCNEEDDNTSRIKIGFTENENATIVPAPPQPPVYCIHASIDPNNTESDDKDFEFPYNTGGGWERAIIPKPSESAQWGLMIRYGDPYEIVPLDPNNRVPLRITWEPDELPDGVFLLEQYKTSYQQEISKIDMHAQSEFELEAGQKDTSLKIFYIPSEEYKVFGIICVGGTEEENNRGRLFDEFSELSLRALEAFGKFPEEPLKREELPTRIKELSKRIKYITYYYPPLDLFDPNSFKKSQKERLKDAIVNWLPERWKLYNTKNSVLFIYIIDHGNENDGSINIDPKSSDPNNIKLSGNELDGWLDDLEPILHGFEIYNYEIIIIVEACYSGKFIEQLTDSSAPTYQRVLISSTDTSTPSRIYEMGDFSFSGYFFEKLFKLEYQRKAYTIRDAYEKASNLIVAKSNQNPQFYPDSDKGYLIDIISDKMAPGIVDTPEIPDIENISILDQDLILLDPNNIQPFRYNPLYFSISISNSDFSLKNAWMDIFHTTPSGELNIIRTDPNNSNLSGYVENTWLFSPGYCLCYPGIYEFWIYVEGENNQVSVPHPFYFEIPYLPDEYEPDDTWDPDLILLTSSTPQIHYLSDSNDIDWIAIPITFNDKYTIKIKPIDQSLDDPNIYRIKAFKLGVGLEEIDFTLEKFSGTEILFFHTLEEEHCSIYLKISSGIDRKWPLPYRIEITRATTGDGSKNYHISMDNPNCLNINDINDFDIKKGSQDNFLYNPTKKLVGHTLIISISLFHINSTKNFSLWIRNHNIMTIEINNNDEWEFIDFPLNNLNEDFDKDGFTNGEECSMGTDPLDPFDPYFSIIPLSEGWNLISFQTNRCYYQGTSPGVFIPEGVIKQDVGSLVDWLSNDTNSPLRDASDPNKAGNWKRIISFDHEMGYLTGHLMDKDFDPRFNSLKYISAGYGYWIRMNAPGVLVVEGQFLSNDTPLELESGWNLIGYIPHDICYGDIAQGSLHPYTGGIYEPEDGISYCEVDPVVPFVFEDISELLKRIISFDYEMGYLTGHLWDKDFDSRFNNVRYIGPKYGYWIKMEENGELIYPNGSLQ